MKPLNVDDIEEYDEVFDDCLRIADDEFCNLIDYEGIFFYGKVIDDDIYNGIGNGSGIDEDKTYCLCPHCNSLFELDDADIRKQSIKCHKCGEEGILANFRDRSQPLTEMCPQYIAYMQSYEDGYVLRLFKAYADYSDRDYDDYTKLSHFPNMRFFEYGREYYHDGEIKYFQNFQEDYNETFFSEVNSIYDDEFWLMNGSEEAGFLDSPYIVDLKDGDEDKPLMYHLTKSFNFKAFRTLRKYGFNYLAESMIFMAVQFPDSSKISEVLGVDYNQIIADVGKDITMAALLAARKVYKLNLRPTEQNINLMLDMDSIDRLEKFKLTPHNAQKVFKYLRNQQNRKKGKNIGKDYVDYLSECEELGFDLTDSRVLYPTDLIKTHKRTSLLIKVKASEECEIGVAKVYSKFHKLCEYDNGKLCVIVPNCCEDIIYEGTVQSHCVGRYVERVAKGEDIILFVRRSTEKDKPFYTMEIRPVMRQLDIVQCRGYGNEDISPEIRAEVDAFLAEYESWFNKRKSTITEEKTTRTYYKAVKKIDGKYISAWDNRTEYIPGQIIEADTDKNPDRVAVKGIHVASLEFAQKYGEYWSDVAILELEVDIQDIVVPDAKDQIRASRVKVIREVPFEEMGAWGATRLAKAA